jgi:quinol monooxygenase YgiN
MPIVMCARVESEVPKRRELMAALLDWAAAVRAAPGGMSASVHEDVEVAGAYCLLSSWPDVQALECHVNSAEFSILLGALNVLGRWSEIAVMQEAALDGDSAIASRICRVGR